MTISFAFAGVPTCAVWGQTTCSVTPPAINFGTYSITASSADTTTSTLQVSCNSTILPSISISYTVKFSTGNAGVFSTRKMLQGASSLNYNIFKNSSYTQILGDGTSSTNIYSASYLLVTSRTDNYTIYGRIPALQSVIPGTYTDNITVTLTY